MSQMQNKSPQGEETKLQLVLFQSKKAFLYAFLFSFVINLLTLATPLYSLQIFDRVLSSASMETLIMLSVVTFFLYICLGILQAVRSFVFMHISNWLDRQLSSEFLLSTLRIQAIMNRQLGAQSLRDLATIKGFISGPTLQHLFDAPWSIIYIAVLFLIHPWMGWLATVAAIILLFVAYLNEKATKKIMEEANELHVSNNKDVDVLTRNAEVIEAMGMAPQIIKKFSDKNETFIQKQTLGTHRSTLITSGTRFFRMIVQMMSYALGGYLVLQVEMTPGSIIAVSILSGKALAPFDAAINTWKSVIHTRKSYERLEKVLRSTPDRASSISLPDPTGHIQLEKVYFAHHGHAKPTLKDINLDFQPGEMVGIIGPSGSGKTTLAKLLVGVWKPSNGAVRLDEADIYQWNRNDIGKFVGYLPQDVELFAGTIKENIARMHPDYDDEKIIEAAKIANAHEMILHLPQGYETEIGNEMNQLSAGQRQRVGLARCFYGDPKYILLDEPNAHLDQVGEAALINALDFAKSKGITTLIIAHRAGVVSKVDRLVVLNEGQIQENGPRDEVLEKVMPKRPAGAQS